MDGMKYYWLGMQQHIPEIVANCCDSCYGYVAVVPIILRARLFRAGSATDVGCRVGICEAVQLVWVGVWCMLIHVAHADCDESLGGN